MLLHLGPLCFWWFLLVVLLRLLVKRFLTAYSLGGLLVSSGYAVFTSTNMRNGVLQFCPCEVWQSYLRYRKQCVCGLSPAGHYLTSLWLLYGEQLPLLLMVTRMSLCAQVSLCIRLKWSFLIPMWLNVMATCTRWFVDVAWSALMVRCTPLSDLSVWISPCHLFWLQCQLIRLCLRRWYIL